MTRWAEPCDTALKQDGTHDPRDYMLQGPPVHASPLSWMSANAIPPPIGQAFVERVVSAVDDNTNRNVGTPPWCLDLMQPTGDRDPCGHPVVALLDRTDAHALSPTQLPEYLTVCAERKGYWFVVYQNPPRHSDLIARMHDPTISEAERDAAQGELSWEMLGKISKQMQGLEILREHEPSTTLGVVTDAYQHPETGTLFALARPFSSAGGRTMCGLIEFGLRGCSLRHAMCTRGDRQYIQVHELSICQKGKRPGTWLYCSVDLSDEHRPPYRPRQFEPPVFLCSHSAQRRCSISHPGQMGRGVSIELPSSLGLPCMQSNTPQTKRVNHIASDSLSRMMGVHSPSRDYSSPELPYTRTGVI